MEHKRLPKYQTPSVTTYTNDEILDELGHAQAYGHRQRRRGPRPASPFMP